ncbi:MAG: PsiF family protein [Burkholderiaceae bacterium]
MSGVAHAQSAAPAPSAQQDRMKACNAEAKGKTGDARKAFMKDCLSAKPAAPQASAARLAQQDKMKSCNKEAAGKKGDERKAFMKQCLSK